MNATDKLTELANIDLKKQFLDSDLNVKNRCFCSNLVKWVVQLTGATWITPQVNSYFNANLEGTAGKLTNIIKSTLNEHVESKIVLDAINNFNTIMKKLHLETVDAEQLLQEQASAVKIDDAAKSTLASSTVVEPPSSPQPVSETPKNPQVASLQAPDSHQNSDAESTDTEKKSRRRQPKPPIENPHVTRAKSARITGSTPPSSPTPMGPTPKGPTLGAHEV